MSRENLEIVRDQYAATNRRDFHRAMSHYAENVELVMPSGIRAGTFRGRQAVGDWFGDWFATFDRDARFDIQELVDPDDASVLLLAKHRASGRASGVRVEEAVIWVYRLRDGKITHLHRLPGRSARSRRRAGVAGRLVMPAWWHRSASSRLRDPLASVHALFALCVATGALLLCTAGAHGAPAVRISELAVPTAGSEPYGIASGPDGNVWFTELRGNKIGRVTPRGTISEFPLPTPASEPLGITPGPDGAVWFAENTRRAGRITVAGIISEFPGPEKQAEIVTGPDGNLWFTANDGNAIGRITPSGTVKEFPVANNPFGIASGPDGNIWFAETTTNRIGRITPAGVTSVFSLPAGRLALAVAGGPDGNIWFTERDGSRIGRITPTGAVREFPVPTASSARGGIVAGGDGALWFTESSAHKVGRITTSGAVSEFGLPGPDGDPRYIALGPDGNLWFTETTGNRIGRVRLLPRRCLVPALKGRTLAQANRLLSRAGCRLGKVTRPSNGRQRLVVVGQRPAARRSLPSGAKVSLRLR